MSECACCTNSSITADCTVNAAIARAPAAGAVLASFGIDTCCGGTASIASASAASNADLPSVLEALALVDHQPAIVSADILPQASGTCGCGCR